MIDYKRVKVSEISAYIQSPEYKKSKILPVSEHRALSYLNNPRAEPGDVVIYLAYQEGELVGYRMILPDKLFLDNKEIKVGWFSCLYVDKSLRGKGIAKMLTAMALEDWDDQILYHDPVTASGSLYIKSGQFNPWRKNDGLRCFLGINLMHYLQSRRLSAVFNLPFKLVESAINTLLFSLVSVKKEKEFKLQKEGVIDSDCASYIEENNENEFIQRGGNELNWIIKYPWIIQSENNPISDRYYFSAFENEFEYLSYSIRDGSHKIRGFMMLLVKNKQMKLLYLHCSEEVTTIVYNGIIRIMKGKRIQTFTCYDERLVNHIKSSKNAFFLVKDKVKPLFVSKKLMPILTKSDRKFQDGDGDNSFT